MTTPISAYNEQANFDLVSFISDEILLEVELNELQQIQLGKIRKITRHLMGEGIVGTGTHSVKDGIFKLADEVAIVGGNILEIEELKVAVAVGHTVYINLKERTVGYTDQIVKGGNLQSPVTVENNIKDPRYDEETSKRIQSVYTLTTSASDNPEDGLYVPIFYIHEVEGELAAEKIESEGQTILDRELANVRTEIDALFTDIRQTNETELNKLREHFQTYNEHSLNRDELGIYRVGELRRKDNTLYQRSTLSNRNASGNYTTQTIDTFAEDGTTRVHREVFTLTYDTNGQVVSRVGV